MLDCCRGRIMQPLEAAINEDTSEAQLAALLMQLLEGVQVSSLRAILCLTIIKPTEGSTEVWVYLLAYMVIDMVVPLQCTVIIQYSRSPLTVTAAL